MNESSNTTKAQNESAPKKVNLFDNLEDSIMDLTELKHAYVLDQMKPDIKELDRKNGIYQLSEKIRLRIKTNKESRIEAVNEYKEKVKEAIESLEDWSRINGQLYNDIEEVLFKELGLRDLTYEEFAEQEAKVEADFQESQEQK